MEPGEIWEGTRYADLPSDQVRIYNGRLRSLTIVKFGSVFCAKQVVNVFERCFVTLVDLSILQQFGVAYFLNFFGSFEA